ncbi:MAG: acetate--CoA ligase [Verrucomicrobia bacterium]|nr:acetate--CoA ligase [Verrucomicrobiota bacterium]
MSKDPKFKPPASFAKQAAFSKLAKYKSMYRESLQNPKTFWGRVGKRELDWFTPPKKILEWETPFAKWFGGGKLNVSYNCLDRHLSGPRRHKAAIVFEGEPGDVRVLTYQQLHDEVCRLANALKGEGVKPGDRVMIYLPMVPEAAVAMLACARIGAVHSVVFGGFSSESLKDRIRDCGAKLVITADGGYRRGQVGGLKQNVDAAVASCPGVRRVIVLKRTGHVEKLNEIDRWWHELVAHQPRTCPPEVVESEHPLFILYTSGSTGKPKGILHTTAGYLLGAHLTTKWVFDLRETDLFWCTADVGWVTGHSYAVYGALSNGTTTLMYEGVPNQPEPDRFWQIIERHRVTVFYTAPTAIRSFIRWGDHWPQKHDLSSLRLLGSVGEPINPEAWMWYHKVIGGSRCPIVDTWWQTETGSHLITTLPGVHSTKPGSAGLPFFGVDIAVVNDQGKEVKSGQQGKLVVRKPWPSMLRSIHGDPERYVKQYWSEIPGYYFTGDGAKKDKDGYFWISGRIDDVLNVSGHRLGTAEVESALVTHPAVAEAAVVGRPDDLKGQAVVAFVTLKSGQTSGPDLIAALRERVSKEIGPIAKPDQIRFAEALPKTRSGKIMRRLLKEVAAGGAVKGDVTTLEDLNVIASLQASPEDG